MNKEARTIAARGLTKSSIGSTIEVDGESFIVEDIAYQGDSTFVKITNYLSIPNMKEIVVYDA